MQQHLSIAYNQYNNLSELPEAWQLLMQQAQAQLHNAQAGYSQFKVAASVLLNNGAVVHGINIENASYPVGICAERSALSSVLSNHAGTTIMAIAITYINGAGSSNQAVSPCGMCRQFMLEVERINKSDIPIICAGLTGAVIVFDNCRSLLPFSFDGNLL
jgi:cytidine deaminase